MQVDRMPIWVTILILIGSIATIYVLSRYRKKIGKTRSNTIAIILVGIIALAVVGYILLSAIFLNAVAT